MPTARRPASMASTSTVPDPQNGSSTVAPGALSARTRRAAVTGCIRAGYV